MNTSHNDSPVNPQYGYPEAPAKHATIDDMKLGHLLLESKIIAPHTFEAALRTAVEFHQPLETVLAVHHDIPAHTLKSARLAQKMIDEMLIDRHTAAEALRNSHSAGLPFDYVAVRTDAPQKSQDEFTELECILLKSGVTTECNIKEARRISAERDIPLGTSLLMLRTVPFAHLNYAFECLHLVNEGRISRSAALNAMMQIRTENVDLKRALETQGIKAKNTLSKIKIGDLLLAGRLINERDMLEKIEESIATRRLIGGLLVESGLLDEHMLKDTLTVQGLCMRGVIDRKAAVKLLRRAVESHTDVSTTARKMRIFRDEPETADGAKSLLLDAGLITMDQLDQAESRFHGYGMGSTTALVASGFLSSQARAAAVECALLVQTELMTEKDAICVLHYCDRHDAGYEEAFTKLGITHLDDHLRSMLRCSLSATNRTTQPDTTLKLEIHKSNEFILLVGVWVVLGSTAMALSILNPFNIGCYAALFAVFVAGVCTTKLDNSWDQRAKMRKFKSNDGELTPGNSLRRLSESKRKLA
ncbi:MAG: hypothetical protein K2X93_00150 [Candidatus Obscuribacterales bacterium]|nr:hypothetical protein [Candidatus Obscuribacterales bacterium]